MKFGILSAEATRKWVHFLVGISLALSPLYFLSNIQPALLAIIFIILNSFAYYRDEFKGINSQSRVSYGTIYFPIAYLVIVIWFWDYSELLAISLGILAISDPLAAQVGQSTLKPIKFKIWNDEKTIQGTLAFFSSAVMIIYMGAHFFFDFSNSYILGLAVFTGLGATIAEITSNKGTDNISIPLVSLLFMIGYLNNVSESSGLFNLSISNASLFIFVIILLFSIAYHFRSLNRSGYYGALIMGILITIIGNWHFLVPLSVFFILSSILSQLIKSASFYRTKDSKRDIIQVYANGGIALVICIYDFLHPNPINFFLFLASIAAAMADTWGTEFGKLSPKKPISILNYKQMDHGLSGGITRIGILGSLLGSSLIGLTIWYVIPTPSYIIYGIIICGFTGSIFDSFLGAIFQAKYETSMGKIVETPEEGAILKSGVKWINNDLVNLLNTVYAPFVMYFYLQLF
ncbi:MAG: DUF92 domain-containing protein [Candidatus Marinimicrobia bacterium]|nr:DUF92 domain-containing protein [Candidatus Neomarinimicrobiota bacterium]